MEGICFFILLRYESTCIVLDFMPSKNSLTTHRTQDTDPHVKSYVSKVASTIHLNRHLECFLRIASFMAQVFSLRVKGLRNLTTNLG